MYENYTGEQLRNEIEKLKADIKDYDELKEALTPILEEMNHRAEVMAANHGKKHYPFSLKTVMR